MTSRDAFGDFTFTAFSAKNIPVVVTAMISANFQCFFSIQNYSFIISSGLKHMTKHMMSFWYDRLFMDDLSWLFFVLEKNKNTCGKDSKYTNAIDII